MRPLPIEAMAGVPPFIKGLSIIRGAPVPVVDVGLLIGDAPGARITRFVTLRVKERSVALAVAAVTGVVELAPDKLQALPLLLGDSSAEIIGAIGSAEAQLLVVLRAARIVPDDVWRALENREMKP